MISFNFRKNAHFIVVSKGLEHYIKVLFYDITFVIIKGTVNVNTMV